MSRILPCLLAVTMIMPLSACSREDDSQSIQAESRQESTGASVAAADGSAGEGAFEMKRKLMKPMAVAAGYAGARTHGG